MNTNWCFADQDGTDKGVDRVSLVCNRVNRKPSWHRQVSNQKGTKRERQYEGQWIMGGGGKMASLMVGMLCSPSNNILFAFIVSTIVSAPHAIQGLTINQAQDQPDSISTPDALVNPKLIQDSTWDANIGQKRFSSIFEWM